MILVTVGQMMGFNRLIHAMDDWGRKHPDVKLIAQIGDGTYKPTAMNWMEMLTLSEFKATVAAAEIIVAHAGMGSFFVSMETGKPIVMMPRHAALGEHTTDHQIHTLQWLRKKPGVFAADEVDDLPGAIERARAATSMPSNFERLAPVDFVNRLRRAIVE